MTKTPLTKLQHQRRGNIYKIKSRMRLAGATPEAIAQKIEEKKAEYAAEDAYEYFFTPTDCDESAEQKIVAAADIVLDVAQGTSTLSPTVIRQRRDVIYQIKSRMLKKGHSCEEIAQKIAEKKAEYEEHDNYVPSVCGKRAAQTDVYNVLKKERKIEVTKFVEEPLKPMHMEQFIDEGPLFSFPFDNNSYIFDELDLDL